MESGPGGGGGSIGDEECRDGGFWGGKEGSGVFFLMDFGKKQST